MTDLVGKTVRLPPELWEQLAARAERTDRSVNYEITQAVQGHVVKVVPDVGKLVSGQYQSGTKVVLPTPAPAHTGTDPDPEKKEKKERKVAPLVVTEEILSDLSEYTGKVYKPKLNMRARELIAGLMAKDATLDDFKEVHRKKAQEWLGTEWAKFLRPSTLYGTKFGEYLAQPEQREEIDPAVADVMRRCGVDPGAS